MECKFTGLRNELKRLEADKETILRIWMGWPVVRRILKTYGLNHHFFGKHFGLKVIDYAFSVVGGTNKLGDCPVIGVMLMIFKKSNIPLSDVFLICVHLKNSLLNYAMEREILTPELLNDINVLIDYNFEGVIKEYVRLYYGQSQPEVCILGLNAEQHKAEPVSEVTPSSEESATAVTSAQVYAEEIDIDMDMIDELIDLEHEAIGQLERYQDLNSETKGNVVTLFAQYSRVLNMMLEFRELAFTLGMLNELLGQMEPDALDASTKNSIVIYVKAIIDDLNQWRTTVFVERTAEDIHYLDKTLLSSISQLEIMLVPQEGDDGDIEFF